MSMVWSSSVLVWWMGCGVRRGVLEHLVVVGVGEGQRGGLEAELALGAAQGCAEVGGVAVAVAGVARHGLLQGVGQCRREPLGQPRRRL